MSTRERVTPAEARQALADLMARYVPCDACGNQQAGPLHRTSARLWQGRADRARRNGDVDPVSGLTLTEAERHLAVMAAA